VTDSDDSYLCDNDLTLAGTLETDQKKIEKKSKKSDLAENIVKEVQMDTIKKNPYRVLGVLANSSERELQKQVAVIKRYSEVGKSKSFDYDFDFIGNISRTAEDVQHASSKIEQAHKKIHHALFWFVNVRAYDDIALNNLKEGNREKAIEVWEKTLKDSVSPKNYTSYHNLSTLLIVSSLLGDKLDFEMIRKGVELKGELIKSEFLGEFIELIGGGITVDQVNIGKVFAEDVIEIVEPLLGSHQFTKNKRIVSLFDSYPHNIKKYLIEKYTESSFRNIEAEIEKTENKRNKNSEDINFFWEILYESTQYDIKHLRDLLGENDIQVQMIADKVANELLQCAIDYFNEWRESGVKDPGQEALKIIDHAKLLDPKGRTKNRIEKNYSVIKEWVDSKPQRDLQDKVSTEVEMVTASIEIFDESSISQSTVDNFIVVVRPKLKAIRDVLGATDEFYLQFSSTVVARALGGVIEIFNSQQQRAIKEMISLDAFSGTISWTFTSINKLQLFDMTPEVRSRLTKNKNIITETETQVQAATKQASGGCYIATMAYGDYDHHQVRILRGYRDEVLFKTLLGRIFIWFYYLLSPYAVKILKNNKSINSMIRKWLDRWIKRMSQR
jgi:hypothetical protein